jgi:hypothetical protein
VNRVHDKRTFSTVALEYLRNLEELETARTLYQGEQKRLLNQLGHIVTEEATRQGQLIDRVVSDSSSDTQDVWISGRYATVRTSGGDKRNSGCSIGIGSYLDYVGLQTLIWFQFNLTNSRRATLDLVGLEKAIGAISPAIKEGGWAVIRVGAQAASVIDLAEFEKHVRTLPDKFRIADAWISERWLTS